MPDLAKLEAMYEKESRLARQHKDKAAELKRKIEEEKGQAIQRSIRNINLSPEEFKKFQKCLSSETNIKKFLNGIGGVTEINGTGTENHE